MLEGCVRTTKRAVHLPSVDTEAALAIPEPSAAEGAIPTDNPAKTAAALTFKGPRLMLGDNVLAFGSWRLRPSNGGNTRAVAASVQLCQ